MDLELALTVVLASVVALLIAAQFLRVPYPILLVIGGLGLGALPDIPTVELEPDLVLVILLPPILYAAAFFTPLRELRRNVGPISLLAVGLVLATMVVVALLAHHALGWDWAPAFVLGAIVSPTDPVAATTIMRRLGAPRRLVNVIEGESLVNDASALVAYKVAVTAAVAGTFSVVDAGLEFIGAVAGGLAIGLVVGFVVAEIRRRLDDIPTEITISLLTGYAAFIPADELDLSGVLAAVTAGIYLGWKAPEVSTPQMRLQGFAVWEILVFLLNAVLFILIGLQLQVIEPELGAYGAGELAGYAAAVCATVIGARFLWGFTVTYLIRAIDRREIQRARRASWQMRVVSSWAGMRGAVSMAAALALPEGLPGRDLILFITFVLILVTVVGQGLTLPALIRRLGVEEDGAEEEAEEVRARLVAARAALARLDELAVEEWTRDETIERVRGLYEFRMRRFKVRAGKMEVEEDIEERSLTYQRMMRDIYTVQRRAVVELRNGGEISNDVMHRVERELDLEESRLEI